MRLFLPVVGISFASVLPLLKPQAHGCILHLGRIPEIANKYEAQNSTARIYVTHALLRFCQETTEHHSHYGRRHGLRMSRGQWWSRLQIRLSSIASPKEACDSNTPTLSPFAHRVALKNHDRHIERPKLCQIRSSRSTSHHLRQPHKKGRLQDLHCGKMVVARRSRGAEQVWIRRIFPLATDSPADPLSKSGT
jgi:hypothetical protein